MFLPTICCVCNKQLLHNYYDDDDGCGDNYIVECPAFIGHFSFLYSKEEKGFYKGSSILYYNYREYFSHNINGVKIMVYNYINYKQEVYSSMTGYKTDKTVDYNDKQIFHFEFNSRISFEDLKNKSKKYMAFL